MTGNLTLRKGLLYFGLPLVLGAVITGSVVAVRAQVGGNPDAGLTDAQRDAKYKSLEKTSVAISDSFTATFVAGDNPIANLPHHEVNVLPVPSELDLEGATAKASEILRGTVNAQRIEMSGPDDAWQTRVISTISVSRWLKGKSGRATIEISQPGRAELGDDLKVFLATDPSDPAVNVGDDVIVFVSSTNQRGYRVALPFKVLKVIQGAIEPNELDTPLASLHGRSASVVLDSIANNVALGTGPVTAVTP
jgi:hypothetical protein